MPIRLRLILLTVTVALALGCENRSSEPLSPSRIGTGSLPSSASQFGAAAIAGGVERAVTLFDACDPDSFNAALGPGTCTRSGGVRFESFLDQLRRHHSIGAWHFAPGVLTMKAGQTLVSINRGGEVHTFTEVEDFGGGIVPLLNELVSLSTVAPECNQLQPENFLAPGAVSRDVEDEGGVEKYQCCIHPWMRAEIRIAEK